MGSMATICSFKLKKKLSTTGLWVTRYGIQVILNKKNKTGRERHNAA